MGSGKGWFPGSKLRSLSEDSFEAIAKCLRLTVATSLLGGSVNGMVGPDIQLLQTVGILLGRRGNEELVLKTAEIGLGGYGFAANGNAFPPFPHF